MVRVEGRGLVMQQLRYADEVKPMSEVPLDEQDVKDGELQLAMKLIEQIATDEFKPEQYEDEVRQKTLALIEQKVAGHEIVAAPAEAPTAKVIDLMEALKASLAGQEPAKAAGKAPAKAAASESKPKRAKGAKG